MTDGGGGGGPPNNSGGQFLLQLLQKPPQNPKPTSSSHNHQFDFPFQSNGHNNPPQQPIHPPWLNFPGFQSPPNNNNSNNTPWGLAGLPPPPNLHFHANQQHQPPIFADDFQRLGLLGGNNNNNNGRMVGFEPLPPQQKDMQNGGLMFGSVPSDFSVLNGSRVEVDRRNVVQSQFGVQRTGPSASSDIWSNRIREFDHGLNSNGRGQWNNLPNNEQGGGRVGGREIQQQQPHQLQHGRGHGHSEQRNAPPGFHKNPKGLEKRGSNSMSARKEFERNVGKVEDSRHKMNHFVNHSYNKHETVRSTSPNRHGVQGDASLRMRLSGQLDRPSPPVGSKLHSVPALDIEESLATLHGQGVEEDGRGNFRRHENRSRDEAGSPTNQMIGRRGQDDLAEQLMNSVRLKDEPEKNNSGQFNNSYDKDLGSDVSREFRGRRVRNRKRLVDCRSDIDRWNAPFLAIYESLVPAEEEKAKQKQLLASLEKLVNKEWPRAQLYLYGSCANAFGVSNSDIDVCLAIEDADINKSEILLKLAEILQADNLQDVQALTRARVPIVKLKDPVTGISCDICINNVLAVVNTKLLRDYAEIDGRLRELAFIVKHWAKKRGVNVTYQGTLSSYAYVLMCIHFLQQRKPAILPCLQGMEATYVVTVDDIECAYFDQVQKLREFGAKNTESIAKLVWAFFDYWAHLHDYANAVISVRTGSIISKRAKEWTRRIGNDRHLICIEDPFETSHDLGRVVDKYSINTLREEFDRAANIMQYDPDPCVTLFEPYVPS